MKTTALEMKERAARQAARSNASIEVSDRFKAASEVANTAGGLLGAAVADGFTRETGAEYVTVDVALVDDNPVNARRHYLPEIVAERSRQIKEDGQLVPAVAYRSTTNPDRYELIDGGYRMRAIKAAGQTQIRLELRPAPTRLECYRLSYRLNENRFAQTCLDNAMAWHALLDGGDAPDQSALMSITGLSKATISKTLRVLDLAPDTLALMATAADRFSLRLCYALALLNEKEGGPAAVQSIVERAITEDIATSEIDKAAAALDAQAPQRKQRETSRQYPMGVEGQAGTAKVWDDGRMVFNLQILDAAARDRILMAITDECSKLGAQGRR